jgi:transcriptional regulator with XRE-family HTH domain
VAEPDPVLRMLGQRIRDYRTAAGITQRLLADRVGLSRASVGNIESGIQDIPVRRLAAFARALSVTPAELLAPGLVPPEQEAAWSRDRTRRLEIENEQFRRQIGRIRAALDRTEETPHA